MANNYDRIFKENVESLLLPLLKKVLGLIPPKLVPIDAKMQLTHESEMDNIRRVVYEEDATLDYGLQIEFHIKDEDLRLRKSVRLKKYQKQLLILSRLRKMELIVKTEVEAMTIHYDIETDALYLQGIEKGIEEGIEKGIEKGIEEGIEKGIEEGAAIKERQVILAQWSLQEFSLERIALMSGASLDRVTQVVLAHLQNEGLTDVEAEQSLEAYQAKYAAK